MKHWKQRLAECTTFVERCQLINRLIREENIPIYKIRNYLDELGEDWPDLDKGT